MPSQAVRGANARLAVDLFNGLNERYAYTEQTAWQGIARLLLSCEIWKGGTHAPFHNVVVYRETNDFKLSPAGVPGTVLKRAEALSDFLARELGLERDALCSEIGAYWRDAAVRHLQPHNLVGNAFRSLVVHILRTFGAKGIDFIEEADPKAVFPGYAFTTRSAAARIDILAMKAGLPVAIMSARWRFRHDRVDVIDEAHAYLPAARRQNADCRFIPVLGEFAPNRLDKVLLNCPPAMTNPILSSAVHFNPRLITEGLGENGRTLHLKSLAWLIEQTRYW